MGVVRYMSSTNIWIIRNQPENRQHRFETAGYWVFLLAQNAAAHSYMELPPPCPDMRRRATVTAAEFHTGMIVACGSKASCRRRYGFIRGPRAITVLVIINHGTACRPITLAPPLLVPDRRLRRAIDSKVVVLAKPGPHCHSRSALTADMQTLGELNKISAPTLLKGIFLCLYLRWFLRCAGNYFYLFKMP